MTDPFAPPGDNPPPNYGPPPYFGPPPGYGPPLNYGPPPGYGFGGYIPGVNAPLGSGPPGELRPTGKTIGLTIVTFGIYGVIYNYRIHNEMKRHTGTGIGGGLAVVLSLLVNIAMPFVTSSEVGKMYELRQQRKPVSGKTGLWVLLTAYGGIAVFFIVAVATLVGTSSHVDYDSQGQPYNVPNIGAGTIVTLVAGYLLVVAASITGYVVWFVKTNRALNNYWRMLGVPG